LLQQLHRAVLGGGGVVTIWKASEAAFALRVTQVLRTTIARS
jgi:hypothetical protein